MVCNDAFVTCNCLRVAIWHKEQLPGDSLAVNETDTLRGLIGKARREREMSVRKLALAAQGAGHKIVDTTLNAIQNGTYKSEPTEETIRAIGWLADVSDEIAFAAAGRALPGPPFAEELPPGVDDLTSTERKAAIVMLRTLVAQRQEIKRYVDQSSDGYTAAESDAQGKAVEVEEVDLGPQDLKDRGGRSLGFGGQTDDSAVDGGEEGQEGHGLTGA